MVAILRTECQRELPQRCRYIGTSETNSRSLALARSQNRRPLSRHGDHGYCARFGNTLIPLDVAGHVAHNLFHLLAEGKSVFYTVTSLFGNGASGSSALVSNRTIQVLQFAILALGLYGSLYTVKRITYRRFTLSQRRISTFLPYALLVAYLGPSTWACSYFPWLTGCDCLLSAFLSQIFI